MANKYRGEITAELDSKFWTLCLPLGALAELEAYFKASNLFELTERLGTGEFSASDLIAILHAGLKGGGHDLTQDEVEEMRSPEGTAGYAMIIARLLESSFATSNSDE